LPRWELREGGREGGREGEREEKAVTFLDYTEGKNKKK